MRVSFILTLMVLLFNCSLSGAQCNAEELNSQCVPQLANGFNYIKSYKIDGIGGTKAKIEYSYVFCKDTQYMINICTPEKNTNGIIVSLYDSKRNKVASSKVDNKFISRLAYQCNSSGIYYIQYTFDGASTYCGGSALAFKRN
ncbi:MAG TPA: hypothetical protein VFU05_00700 [Cyclobacteriaceae bacterium]|nr:hypothetical protein [Cyclobacteriaceae bacterium]